MAVSLLQFHEVSDLCIGKPAVKSLPPSDTIREALLALKRGGETFVSVWVADRASPEKKACAGKVCMVDVLCYLCSEENISSPAVALGAPLSALLPPKDSSLVRRVEPHSSVLEALDVILDGAQNLAVPIRSGAGRKKLPGGGGAADFCWLTPEDFVRFFLNSIALFSPAPALSVSDLDIVRPAALAIRPHDPALAALPLIRRALADQTSVAVVTDDGKLIGEISPSTLAHCDEGAAAALAALSAVDLMGWIDFSGAPPEAAVRAVKARLRDKGMAGMVELLEADLSPPFSSSSSASSSSSSSDEESGAATVRRPRRLRSAGSYSARMGRRSEEAIVCHPGSSLMAVMIQALAHRVSYVWVVDDDYSLVGIVALPDILGVFREQLQQPFETQ
ncbi:CBS domain-containing protein CBSX5-like [Phoenix dactylifera]|uniref:CBS domain-containing protein CBSX5-like n=1 Tax=Phoenix dactylifera TaxID=42345 RepID=A0A8B8ZGZ2_PHODC|nr:CBS domain-containing protein CBSX5-like [Phoenix dactylifera]